MARKASTTKPKTNRKATTTQNGIRRKGSSTSKRGVAKSTSSTASRPRRRARSAQTNSPSTPTRRVVTTANGDDLDWRVIDTHAMEENWNRGVPLSRATFPGVSKRGIDPNAIVIDIGDWISVKYRETQAKKKQPTTAYEFANVRAMRLMGSGRGQSRAVLLCVSWGYPIKSASNRPRTRGLFQIRPTAQPGVDLSDEDLVASDHLDIIHLEEVADMVHEPSHTTYQSDPFIEVIDTQDVAKWRDEDDHDVRLCTSIWMSDAMAGTRRTFHQGLIKSEDPPNAVIGRIYRTNDPTAAYQLGAPSRMPR